MLCDEKCTTSTSALQYGMFRRVGFAHLASVSAAAGCCRRTAWTWCSGTPGSTPCLAGRGPRSRSDWPTGWRTCRTDSRWPRASLTCSAVSPGEKKNDLKKISLDTTRSQDKEILFTGHIDYIYKERSMANAFSTMLWVSQIKKWHDFVLETTSEPQLLQQVLWGFQSKKSQWSSVLVLEKNLLKSIGFRKDIQFRHGDIWLFRYAFSRLLLAFLLGSLSTKQVYKQLLILEQLTPTRTYTAQASGD